MSSYELFIPLALASPLSYLVNFPWALGYKSCERYNFFPSSKLLFLSNLGSKLDVSSCEILFLSYCVNGVCYFHLWVSPILQVLWIIWFSSFNSKLLFLLYLNNKLFVSSCDILFVNFYVRFVIFIYEFLLNPQVFWKLWCSSFSKIRS
jgi:hypothetical protein